jgi:hypothetical protein
LLIYYSIIVRKALNVTLAMRYCFTSVLFCALILIKCNSEFVITISQTYGGEANNLTLAEIQLYRGVSSTFAFEIYRFVITM